MDDELPFASHITKRGRVYQYVRRVPEDLGDAFPFARVQRSLRTQDRVTAYEAAARVHSEIEKRFAAARGKKGTTLNVVPIDDWDWTDWNQLADWFKAVLLDEDWRMRLRNVQGAPSTLASVGTSSGEIRKPCGPISICRRSCAPPRSPITAKNVSVTFKA
jgi:hypothetical protein